jgi:hypothetical protein
VFQEPLVQISRGGLSAVSARGRVPLRPISTIFLSREDKRRDAILYSVGANEAHGLRRTNDDKPRAVMTLLTDAEWATWSDREIARRCAVSPDFVSKLHRSLSSDDSEARTYTTKHGTVATMNTAAIGKPADGGGDSALTCEARSPDPLELLLMELRRPDPLELLFLD